MFSALFMFIVPGQMEIVLIVLAILLLFGGRKIPEMMRGLGTGVKEFRKGIKDESSDKDQIPGDENDTNKKE